MSMELKLNLISFVVGLVLSGVPLLVKILFTIKQIRNAKTLAEKEEAKNKLLLMAKTFIKEAEDAYAMIDTEMKAKGLSCGKFKKLNVMSNLKEFAMNNHLLFDDEEISKEVDELVKLTKQVNNAESEVQNG